jgi:hypothetical protein
MDIDQLIAQEQAQHLSPVIKSIYQQETGGGRNVRRSTDGANGPMQVMPATYKQMMGTDDVGDPALQTQAGIRYIKHLAELSNDDPAKIAAGYFSGPGNIAKDGPTAFVRDHKDGNGKTVSGYVADVTGRLPPVISIDQLQQTGYGDQIAVARQRGYSDAQIANRLSLSAASQPQAQQMQTTETTASRLPDNGGVEQAIAQMVAHKMGSNYILSKLADAGMADTIKVAQDRGYSADEIVQRLGGQATQQVLQARSDVDKQSFGTNVVQGAKAAGSDMLLGAKQILSLDDQNKADLQAEARARAADPRRQAVAETAGGTVGNRAVKAVPAIAAGALTGGAGIVPMVAGQAAAGAVSGALEPTTEDGQRSTNVLRDAVLGGGTAGVLGVGGKVLGSAASKALSRSPELVAERQALADAARAQGLPVNAATLTDAGRNLASRMPDNASITAMRGQADDVLAGKIADGLGVSGYTGAIDTNLLNAARPQIRTALNNATNVSVTLPQSMKADLASLMTSTANPLTEGIASTTVARQAAGNLVKAIDSGAAVSGKQLQDLASELKAVAQNHAASAAERQTAGQLVGKVNKALTDAMTPDQAKAFAQANKQYSNMKAVEKMVSLSNDTGAVSPRQMIQAVKTGRFKTAFLKDEAPFQELSTTASNLYGPVNGRGLGDILGRAIGTGDSAIGAASVLSPTTGLPLLGAKKLAEMIAGKALTSDNPTVLRLLTGIDGGVKGIDPTTRKYIAKALAAAGGSAGTD